MSTAAVKAIEDAAQMAAFARELREVKAKVDRHEEILRGLGPDFGEKFDAVARAVGLDGFISDGSARARVHSGVSHA